jgi:hypothetical protein
MPYTPFKRRDFFKYSGLGLTGIAAPGIFTACSPLTAGQKKIRERITEKVFTTTFIDTHEHLMNESERVNAGETIWEKANDWTYLFSHYFDSDMAVAGMYWKDHGKFYTTELSTAEKWKLIEPFWPYLKYTGYGQNLILSIRKLYGIDDLNAENISTLEGLYHDFITPGFYEKVIRQFSNIESCQVNLWPFLESEQPGLLLSDLHISGMLEDAGAESFSKKAGITVSNLANWHAVIDWWFDWYGKWSVSVKCATAYSRNIDFERVPAEKAEKIFLRKIKGETLPAEDKKMLEDHLFWYCVDKATAMGLPVKVHTGYYAGWNGMPLGRVAGNAAAACDLCKLSPETKFDFFHTCYPFYEDILAVAKQYQNAYMDMCWAWIINPVAAKDFLKKFIVTVPLNKIVTFGGDYMPVELVYGHSEIARRGIVLALSELVEEGWISPDAALEIADHIMHGNARKLFRLEEKYEQFKGLNWKELNGTL